MIQGSEKRKAVLKKREFKNDSIIISIAVVLFILQ